MQVSLSIPVLIHEASNKPSLNHSLPNLHGVTNKLDTPIVVANSHIAFIFEDRDDVTKSSLFMHLRDTEDLVEGLVSQVIPSSPRLLQASMGIWSSPMALFLPIFCKAVFTSAWLILE
ncbi:hypothetical protein Tco_0430932 [Tanacetum coccineum]